MLMVMVFAWSLNFVISKFALREMPASFIVGIRNLAAGLVILPFYIWERRTVGPATWAWKEAPALFALGFLGVAMNQMFFILGISRTTVAHAAVVIGLAPVSTMIVAILFKQERLNAKRLIGMALAISGVAVLQLAHLAEPARNGIGPSLLGDLFIYLSGIAYAMFTVLGKRYTKQHSGITMNTFAYAGSGVALLPLTWYVSQGVDVLAFSWRAWMSVAYMAIFSSVMGYLILYWALRWMPASRVSTFTYAQPVMATVLGILLLHESPAASLYMGGALVFAGVMVSERL
jgi:drug/metabolite transporter (DMT)-like permease